MRNLAVALLLVSVAAFAQDTPPTGGRPSGGRIESPTRGVVKYRALERALLQAEEEKKISDARELLADDFEVWSAEKAEPTPRELWERDAKSSNLTWFQIRNVAVREFGGIAVVSFLLDRKGHANGRALPATVFVVDVWQQQAGKLAVRYISAPGKPAVAQLMPTGKE